mgnify:CR=1 FL=1
MRDEVEDVETGDALRSEQPGGVGLRLLEDGGEHVAGVHLGPLSALHVEHRRLQHAPERRGLLGLALLPAAELLDGTLQVLVQLASQADEIGPRALQDAFALGVVGERVQQVFERQVRVPARHCLAVGNRQDDLNRRGEHDRASVLIIECTFVRRAFVTFRARIS